MPNLLIIDDDDLFARRLARGLESDYAVTCLGEADAAVLERLAAGEFFAVLLDNYLPGSEMSGLEFLEERQKRGITVPVILMSGYGGFNTVIAAKKMGAFDYVQKGSMDELLKELKQLLARIPELVPPVGVPGIEAPEAPAGQQLIGNSPAMTCVYKNVGGAAKIAQPVLIVGEAGTGKDLVARAIHANGPRRDKLFVVVRCHTFNDDLLRDELFGHEIGFRGEGKLRKGKIEYASGGTLYLDDVDALPWALQDDVLRVLEERQVTRQGDNEEIPVDVRVVAASRHNLRHLPESKFRRELLDHLATETITLPPLRERAEDLEPLVNYVLQQEAALAGLRHIPTLAAECWGKLRAHKWPGNVRELQTVVRKAVVACRGSQILDEDLVLDDPSAKPQILAGLRIAISSALSSTQTHLYDMLLDLLRKELVVLTLEACQGNTREAERRLGVSPDHLRNPDEQVPNDETPTEKLPRAVERRIKALVLIQTYPEWTVIQYADKLGCSKSTLDKDKLIKQALKLRKNDLRLPHGHKDRDGNIDAYSGFDNEEDEDE
jgi:two-component system nitrogen regulation response regulator GlnG